MARGTRGLLGGVLPAVLAALLAAPASALPRLPWGWPRTLGIGLTDGPGGARALRASAPFGFRYQYLSGGVNTGAGWSTWNPGGSFVTGYAKESFAHRVVPVFPYYMLLQSAPAGGDEQRVDLAHLRDRALMRAYYRDFELLLRRAGAFRPRVIVVHVEPDLFGYVEQAARGDRASTVPAAVSSTGLPEVGGLPNDVRGFARALVRLRRRLAPNVILAYHLSDFGTNVDIGLSNPPPREVDRLAGRAARFYRSLGARFDLAFTDVSDADSAFKQIVRGDGGASWWGAADFGRNVRFLAGFVRLARLRVAIWQIPLGNTLMRAMDDTWGHYQDNRVQWLLGDASRRHLRAYARAGVVGLLFGGGGGGTTCACDAQHDGVTDPAPIGGNDRRSLSADDDGGYFRDRVRVYYRRGPLRLAAGR